MPSTGTGDRERGSPPGGERALVTFLNHGQMPFVGRVRELERLEALVAHQAEAEGLRLALIVGEAGSGKSALAGALAAAVARPDRAVLRIRLHPGGSTAIGPAVASAAMLATNMEHLLRREPEAGLDGALTALRRIAGVRATVLLVEDLHLLSGEALHDLGRLLDGLAELAITVVAFSRPLEAEAHGVLALWLVDELRLEPLTVDDVREVWRSIFSTPAPEDVVDALHGATLGVPLALRSALRTAVTAGWIADEGAGWRASVSAAELRERLHRTVDLLPRGMLAHLSDAELAAARRLASLGEVLSRHAARHLLADADRLVDILTFRGVLLPVAAPPRPILGGRGDLDARMFAHTLLHRHLCESAPACSDALVAAIGSGAPLYSSLPVAIVRDGVGAGGPIAPAVALDAAQRLIAGARAIDETSDWSLGTLLLDAADAIVAAAAGSIEPSELRLIELELMRWRINSLRRAEESPAFAATLARFVAATEPPLPEALVGHRIAALRSLALSRCHFDGVTPGECWEEMEAFLRSYPSAIHSEPYLSYLLAMTTLAIFQHDPGVARRIEARFEEIESAAVAPPAHIAVVRRRLRTKLLSVCETPSELERRLAHLEILEREGTTPDLAMHKAVMFSEIGRFDEMIALIDEWLPRFERMGLGRNAAQFAVLRATARMALGASALDVRAEIDRLIAAARPAVRVRMATAARTQITMRCLLLGEPESIESVVAGLESSGRETASAAIALAAARNDIATLEALAIADPLLAALAARARGVYDVDDREIAERFRARVDDNPSLLERLGILHASLELLRLRQCADVAETLRGACHDAVLRALDDLEEVRLGAFILPLVDRARAVLTKREAEARRAVGHRLVRERAQAAGGRAGAMPSISMVGSVTIDTASERALRVRGARVRTLLGLLVVSAMLERPLERQELTAIATGEPGDTEASRKSLNGIVLRLRELLGPEAVLTDGDTPRLHPDVRVDLLDALAHARAADEACAHQQLSRAYSSALALFATLDGRVPFAGLYDPIFELARDQVEAIARRCALRAGGALAAAGDFTGAATLLARAVASLPGDDELAERLAAALDAASRPLEAQRVRSAALR